MSLGASRRNAVAPRLERRVGQHLELGRETGQRTCTDSARWLVSEQLWPKRDSDFELEWTRSASARVSGTAAASVRAPWLRLTRLCFISLAALAGDFVRAATKRTRAGRSSHGCPQASPRSCGALNQQVGRSGRDRCSPRLGGRGLCLPNVRAETGAAVGRQAREEHQSHWRIAGLVHRRCASARARG